MNQDEITYNIFCKKNEEGKMLNLDSFQKSIESLDEALKVYKNSGLQLGSKEETLMRDGIIQRFEYTFELSWKTIKRYIEMYGLEKVDGFTNKQLFRVAFEQGLIKDSETWLDYLKRRNLASHVYDEVIAKQVYEKISEFLVDVLFLFEQLKEKLNA